MISPVTDRIDRTTGEPITAQEHYKNKRNIKRSDARAGLTRRASGCAILQPGCRPNCGRGRHAPLDPQVPDDPGVLADGVMQRMLAAVGNAHDALQNRRGMVLAARAGRRPRESDRSRRSCARSSRRCSPSRRTAIRSCRAPPARRRRQLALIARPAGKVLLDPVAARQAGDRTHQRGEQELENRADWS